MVAPPTNSIAYDDCSGSNAIFEARASHHNHTICKFSCAGVKPVISNNLRIIAWNIPLHWKNYQCRPSYGSLFFPFRPFVNSYSRGHPLPYPVWCDLTLHRMDGATVDAWLYFPGTKLLVALIMNRYVVTELIWVGGVETNIYFAGSLNSGESSKSREHHLDEVQFDTFSQERKERLSFGFDPCRPGLVAHEPFVYNGLLEYHGRKQQQQQRERLIIINEEKE
ncbi:hypothetical protein DAPPUDRAFT_240238 [Daphnia pulex]|uniref:Uncharacterized protein n=1 Tax=Daphnia pulex TaxID=6669 RepID=E9GB84_DAPPU|nr:hypothetical protein DAPPUDRAFT_240238 [Daphnia pulex]|eukprot:EFX83403.1 hypothetical protein DAPPUDRAFT_240238 [Daphnia pulex]